MERATPTGPASYDAERIGAVPTSWILTQVGSTLSASVTTVVRPTQVLPVADSSKFRTGDLIVIENEKCLVTAVGAGTITVRRGWAGSTAVTHGAGVRVAAAVSSWPYSVKLDLTSECPSGRAGGMFATPGTGNERARDWMARRTAGHLHAASWDGVAIDLCTGYISWFKGDNPAQLPHDRLTREPRCRGRRLCRLRRSVDGRRTGLSDERALAHWPRCDHPPERRHSRFGCCQRLTLRGLSQEDHFDGHLARSDRRPEHGQLWLLSADVLWGQAPNFTTMQTYGDAIADYQLMRFGLTSSLMADGFYSFAVGDQRCIRTTSSTTRVQERDTLDLRSALRAPQILSRPRTSWATVAVSAPLPI